MIYRSFEFINIYIILVYNYNFRFVVIYWVLFSFGNGFMVRMFLEEFSFFLEGFVLIINVLLVVGDFNFYIDEFNDCDVWWFL